MKHTPTVVAATALAAWFTPVTAAVSMVAGQPFPDLVLPSMTDGRPMSLSDFRGRKVILQVFASW